MEVESAIELASLFPQYGLYLTSDPFLDFAALTGIVGEIWSCGPNAATRPSSPAVNIVPFFPC